MACIKGSEGSDSLHVQECSSARTGGTLVTGRRFDSSTTLEQLVIKYRGDMADEHRLPAYPAAQSLAGLSRALLIPAIYLQTGKVRHRALSEGGVDLNLTAVRPGSLEGLLEFALDPERMAIMALFARELTRDIAKDFAKDFIYGLIKRATGGSASKQVEDAETSGKLPTGDTEAISGGDYTRAERCAQGHRKWRAYHRDCQRESQRCYPKRDDKTIPI
jgi:hypothetical protein